MIASAYSPLLILLLLACPLMMIFMMRGHGHGHGQNDGQAGQAGGSHGGQHGSSDDATKRPSLEELRARVDDLEAQLRARRAEETEPLTAAR